MAPFDITSKDGLRTASNGAQMLTLLEDDGKLFRRRAVKGVGTAQVQNIEWAVAELDGVRVYIDGANVIVTRRDLQP